MYLWVYLYVALVPARPVTFSEGVCCASSAGYVKFPNTPLRAGILGLQLSCDKRGKLFPPAVDLRGIMIACLTLAPAGA